MGIPKFFRFISERWPLITEYVNDHQIPEFDNLYLDMNSILHTCTRPKDGDMTRRLSEEDVYGAIFAYIDHLFDIIRPQKVFYMAIDGVAPRAKMNQQRSRRFRTAVDAEKNMKKAIEQGLELPKEEPFDSNSITPGTEFMAKLTNYLKYFIHKKISTDSRWQGIEVILSGHEVPGEGEHKIMEFIRNKKALPDYNPNLRHCIYGLDADLIMLGLVSHEPHFALLREEVQFGRVQTQAKTAEDQKFCLLQLSLVREYLELEFNDLKSDLVFGYDFERILDDFILVLYVIGNDFLPNLPDLHLNKGAFPLLLQTFKETLRTLDGYMNEFGKINVQRLGKWLDQLSKFELENFEQVDVDLEWFNKKLENISISGEKKREKQGKLIILKQQRKLVGTIKPWLIKTISIPYEELIKETDVPSLDLPNNLVENNLDFLKTFAFDTGLIVTHSRSTNVYSVRVDIDGIDPHLTPEESAERINEIRRVIKRFESAVILDNEGEDAVEEQKQIYNEKFESWKDIYYQEKFNFSIKDESEMIALTENYIEGLQWVLYYYYQGCASWSWYFKYHYSPRISDVKKGLNIKFNFDKSTPFKPFEQLMAVLPARSQNLVPKCYRTLMTDPNSPIIDFYPNDVELDMNGKTAEWEAVVKLSFVDQKRLIAAMEPYNVQLTPEERKRNSFGQDLVYIFNSQIDEVYKTPASVIFGDLEHNKCYETPYNLKHVDANEYITGLCKDALVGIHALSGFPSLKTINFTSELKLAGVKIFNQPSRSQSFILKPESVGKNFVANEENLNKLLNKIVYTRYPFLRESKVLSISDGTTEYLKDGNKLVRISMDSEETKNFKRSVKNLMDNYLIQKGIELKEIKYLVKVAPIVGLKKNVKGGFEKDVSKYDEIYPLELVVRHVENPDQRLIEKKPLPINEEFPIDSKVIFLGDYSYGSEAKIIGYTSSSRVIIEVSKNDFKSEPTIGAYRASIEQKENRYYPSYEVARKLKLHPLFLSRIASTFFVLGPSNQRVNVGLDLKFDSRREKVLGFARKNEKTWEYSVNAISLFEEYRRSYGDIFNSLMNFREISPGKYPTMTEILSKLPKEQAIKKFDALRKWLKLLKANFVQVSLESDGLTKVGIQEIENGIEAFVASNHTKLETKKLAGVPREAILQPAYAINKLKTQSFKLGDRVVYIHDSGKVPLFSKGTVVKYVSKGSDVDLEVVFDNVLVGGNKLDGKLRTNRGLKINSSLVLNLSFKQFIFHSKASRQKTGSQPVRKAITKPAGAPRAGAGKPNGAQSKANGAQSKPAGAQSAPKAAAPKPKQPQAEPKQPQSEPKRAGNELLSILKGGKAAKAETQESAQPANVNKLQNSYALKHIQYSILNQPPQQPQP